MAAISTTILAFVRPGDVIRTLNRSMANRNPVCEDACGLSIGAVGFADGTTKPRSDWRQRTPCAKAGLDDFIETRPIPPTA
jgi:hypothetical protein